jgi:putative transport protein
MTYPFNLRATAETALSHGGSSHKFKTFVSTGESFDSETRDLIVQAFGCRTIDLYAAREIGQIEIPTTTTNHMLVALAIVIGAYIGLPYLMVGALKLSLSTSVGVLVAGLFFGWLYSVKPIVGKIPDASINLMSQLGLAGFVAVVGLHAGPVFLDAVRDAGVRLLLGGAVVTLVPLFIAFAFGRYVLRMAPIQLIGAIAGTQTLTPALVAVQEKADSQTPVLGYTVPYALANILLTMWGGFMVMLRVQFG